MILTFLGGGNEVGASSTIIEIKNKRVIVDCGIRMTGDDSLPDLSKLREIGSVDAIFVTHAHMDHTGSLPVLHRYFPTTPIFATPPTIALMQILLRDAIKIMQDQMEAEREIPLYSLEAVESMLQMVKPVPFNYTFSPFNDSNYVTFFSAGHIMGAASIGLQSDEGSIFISGDISITDQITVLGMSPPNIRPNVVVMESTYGDRLHANRKVEENKLVKAVIETIEEGGKVLIPAFALGRAQEVILIFLKEFNKKGITPFPIYVDGMVRSVCRAYSKFPNYLTPYLRRKIEHFTNPFFNVSEYIVPVPSPDTRNKILEGGPCCIIASSGMLSGGPSQFYASKIVSDPKNLIAITGYQDEESPGRQLINLAEIEDNQEKELHIGGEKVNVRCKVKKYSLSAHADSGEITGLLSALKPSDTILVHGDQNAREALSKILKQEKCGRIYLPENGDSIELLSKKRGGSIKPKIPQSGIGQGEFNLEKVKELYDHVMKHYGHKSLFTIQELCIIWYGNNYSNENESKFEEILNKSQYFEADFKRPFLYHCVNEDALKNKKIERNYLEQNAMSAKIVQYFPIETGLYKKGLWEADKRVVLYFYFPEVAKKLYAEKIKELEAGTGWSIEISSSTHQGALIEKVYKLFPNTTILKKTPAIYIEKLEVLVTISGQLDKDLKKELQEKFLKETGFTLLFKEVLPDTPIQTSIDKKCGKMEINSAFAWIDKKFANEEHKVHKKSKKRNEELGEYIELSFISKEIAENYNQLITQLEEETGWKIKINPEPDQNSIKQVAKSLLKPEWGAKKDPSFIKLERKVRVKLTIIPPAKEWEEVQKFFNKKTGYNLEFYI